MICCEWAQLVCIGVADAATVAAAGWAATAAAAVVMASRWVEKATVSSYMNCLSFSFGRSSSSVSNLKGSSATGWVRTSILI